MSIISVTPMDELRAPDELASQAASAATEPASSTTRPIEIDGTRWIASLAGRSAAGSGVMGLGLIEAVDFALASAPGIPMREVLLQRGRFAHMYDDEIAALFAISTPVTTRRIPQEPR